MKRNWITDAVWFVVLVGIFASVICIALAQVKAEADDPKPTKPQRWKVSVWTPVWTPSTSAIFYDVENFAHRDSFCEFDTTNHTHIVISGNWLAERQ